MSESYQHVVKGGLKLKGGVPGPGGVKKKKKKDKHEDKEKDDDALTTAGEGGSNPPKRQDNRTAVEKRYDEQAAKTQARLIQSMASKSHKDKVKDFNEYLSKLSEHHDIPKVGPG
mmetsp:Transcript_650/g.2510  ORF Transcript_650/g.2510 Transcript_650/m.2510 type:complete len:115 (+) Transcript_650:27-371(+)